MKNIIVLLVTAISFMDILHAEDIFIDDNNSRIIDGINRGILKEPNLVAHYLWAIIIKGDKEQCSLSVLIAFKPLSIVYVDKGTCLHAENSKGKNIFCTQPKKEVCKTYDEVSDTAFLMND